MESQPPGIVEPTGKGRGFLLMIGATLALAGVVLFVGLTHGAVPVENLLVIRGCVFLSALGPWAFRHRALAKGGHRKLLLLRGVVGVVTQACTIIAATRIPISIASLLQKTAPFWTFFLAWVLLGIRPLGMEFLALPVAVIGLWMLAQPDHALDLQSISHLGLGAGLAGGLFNALEIICMRRLRHTDGPNAINFWYAAVTAAVALPLCFDGGWPRTPEMWGYAVGYSLCALIGQSMLAAATRTLSAIEASVGTLLKPVFAGVLGWLVLHQTLDGSELVGMGLVLLAAGAASVAEHFRPIKNPEG